VANIGKLSAVITADASPFLKGASAAAAGASAAASTIGTAAKSIAGSLSIAAVGFGGLATVATGAVALAMRSVAGDLIKTDNAARKVGVSILDYRAAAIWAGAASGEFTGALATLQNNLDATGVGSLAVAADLRSLATLSGTTEAALREGGWASIVDSLAKIESPTVRAAQAFQVLGGNAAGVLAELERGGGAATKDMASRLGLGATASDVNSIRMIDRAFRDLLAVRDGAINQAVLGLAPIGAELTKLFSEVRLNLTWIKPMVFNIVESVAMFGVKLAAIVSDSEMLAMSFSVAENKAVQIALSFKAGMLSAIADIQQAFNPLVMAIERLPSGSQLPAASLAMGVLGPQALGGGEGLRASAANARRMAADAGDEAELQRKRIEARLRMNKMVQDTMTFFTNARARMDGGGGGAMDAVRRAGSSLASAIVKPFSASAVGELTGRFNAMRQATRSPAASFVEQMRDMNDMKDAGKFVGQMGVQRMGAFQAMQNLRQGLGVPAVSPLAGVAEAGTRDAYSAVANYRQQGRGEKVLDEIKRLLAIAAEQRARQEKIGQDIVDAVKELGAAEGMRID
jgi:hypothetical protein